MVIRKKFPQDFPTSRRAAQSPKTVETNLESVYIDREAVKTRSEGVNRTPKPLKRVVTEFIRTPNA